MGIFDVNNAFFQGLNKVIDSILLNIIWLLFCFPAILTCFAAYQSGTFISWLIYWLSCVLVGPATTAFYYTVNKVLRHNRSYVLKEYWYALQTNFKQAAAAALLLSGFELFMALDGYIMYQLAAAGETGDAWFVLFIIFGLAGVMWSIYTFTYMARFENTLREVLKNTALIAAANLPWTLLLLLLLFAAIFFIWMSPLLLLAAPVAYMLAANLILERIYKKYMSDDEIATEQERNREFYN